jgi:hypothetical protein
MIHYTDKQKSGDKITTKKIARIPKIDKSWKNKFSKK